MLCSIKKFIENFTSRLGIAGELLRFFWRKKAWWLLPIVIFLLLFSILIIFAQGAAVVPFVYPLF